ncbi:alpha-L-rhamnosidase-related protein [Streptomyces albogriseolus]|uniref:alpha-L-rhamnosidase-related protein n=1 Tax=Streptomyces albogriseolus TaxID=1887 RepID=UPI0038202FC4
MHTDAPATLTFATDSPMLNQLHRNITSGQRGNFLSVPTDTPARDERLGWTGDIDVFAPTAASTVESARFLTMWLADLRDAQTPEGSFTHVAPDAGHLGDGRRAGGMWA